MSQLDAIALSAAVQRRLVDFAGEAHYTRNTHLAAICRRLWSGAPAEGGLVSDLWVEGAFPAQSGDETLQTLAARGLFDASLAAHLDARGAVPKGRALYTHQSAAIIQARHTPNHHKPALVVTAGTGAGKTESFLLPVLDALWSEPPSEKAGVRCLILYPMNALVNDQVDRLYGWMRGQNRLSLFHFTSETPEDKRAADRDGVPEWDACRFRTRKEARAGVPDILITNYSMLEYMLCRPQDTPFFGPNLSAVVLDEAHLYTGTLAAEMTLLLRRLLRRCGKEAHEILTLATSATIGSGAPGELENFAATLFSRRASQVQVIRGERARPLLESAQAPSQTPVAANLAALQWLQAPTLQIAADGATHLAENRAECARLAHQLPLLVAPSVVEAALAACENRPAVLLQKTLCAAPLTHALENALWNEPRRALGDLAREIWPEQAENEGQSAIRATLALLQMGAAARGAAGDYPLLPHRIHLLARAPEGLTLCLNADCTAPADLKMPSFGAVAAGGGGRCAVCAHATLSLFHCANCGEWALGANDDGLRLIPAYREQGGEGETLFLQAPGASSLAPLVVDARDARRLAWGTPGLVFERISDCPCCGAGRDSWQPFASGAALPMSIVAETALAELPPYPAAHHAHLPAQGRRLLAFSDSRGEAARLGPRLTRQHETQLGRAATLRCLENSPASDEETLEFWRGEVRTLEARLSHAPPSPALRQTLQNQLDEARLQLQAQHGGGSMRDWARLLESEPLLHQFFDFDGAGEHQAATWTPQKWEENFARVSRHALLLLAGELSVGTRRRMSLESLGLAEVTYPGLENAVAPAALLGTLPDAALRDGLSAVWPDFLAALCDTLRLDGVWTLGSAEEDMAYPAGRQLLGYWVVKNQPPAPYFARFTGDSLRQRRRRFAFNVLQNVAPCDNAEALSEIVLNAAFDQLLSSAETQWPWLEGGERSAALKSTPGLRLRFPDLGLRRPQRLFRCPTTGHVWPRSVAGCAPEAGCRHLQPIDAVALNDDPRRARLRRELAESPVFALGLWAEEHSAQLAPAENRRLQDLFKAGVRNVLSSTTTLELGIDIGGLSAVLMGNVPPGKANYLQRAGRAGRRADGSSVVITFARPNPFDRAVFARFGDYMKRDLRRPVVFLDRARVVRRHAHALLLGEFFRQLYGPAAETGAMRAFGNMGEFCGVPLPPKWDRGAKPALDAPAAPVHEQFVNFLRALQNHHDTALHESLRAVLRGTKLQNEPDDWTRFFGDTIAQFEDALATWRSDYDELLAAWQEIENAPAQANALRYQMAALWEMTVIEAFADRQFLPRYGFPIGVQKLRVITFDDDKKRLREEDQFRLERPGLLALREYVPGSQLLAGGRLITSRGLLKHWTGAALDNYLGVQGRYTKCLNGHFFYALSGELGACPVCGEAAGAGRHLLLPRHGFSSAAWDPPRHSTDVERVGSVEQATITFSRSHSSEMIEDDFAEISGLRARYREDGELLVYNDGEFNCGFAICTKCGYADSEKRMAQGAMHLPSTFAVHARLTSKHRRDKCWNSGETFVLRNRTLAASETTDALMLDFSASLGDYADSAALLETLGRALQVAGARCLELDGREISVLTVPAGVAGQSLGVVLLDNVPGGAGHVRELLGVGRLWLEAAREALFVDAAHHARCETACIDCLLTFDAQTAMSQGLLSRRFAHDVLEALLGSAPLPLAPHAARARRTIVSGAEPSLFEPESPPADPVAPVAALSVAERRARAARRRPNSQ